MNPKNSMETCKNPPAHNYGIDALRMLAMLMVVTLHILGQGGVLDAAVFKSAQYEAAWFLEIAAYPAVNCYALISGYVGISAKYKYQNIIMLWLRVAFYTLSITLLYSILVPGAVSLTDWGKALLPVTSGYYWYFSAYFALFFFLPILNTAMNKLSRSQHKAVVVGLILVFSCLQTLFSREIFGTASNAWWLMILYVIGGYIGKYGLFQKSGPIKMLGGYVIVTTFTWLSKILIESGLFPFSLFPGKYLVNNSSVTILLSAVFLLLLFERLHFPQSMVKIIRFFSPMAFSVYVIHGHPFVWDSFLDQKFVSKAGLPVLSEIFSILLTAISIYTVCSLIDVIRSGIFKGLRLKTWVGKIEGRYIKDIWNSPT